MHRHFKLLSAKKKGREEKTTVSQRYQKDGGPRAEDARASQTASSDEHCWPWDRKLNAVCVPCTDLETRPQGYGTSTKTATGAPRSSC